MFQLSKKWNLNDNIFKCSKYRFEYFVNNERFLLICNLELNYYLSLSCVFPFKYLNFSFI